MFHSQIDSYCSIPWNSISTPLKFLYGSLSTDDYKQDTIWNFQSSCESFKKESMVIDFDNDKQWAFNKIVAWIKFPFHFNKNRKSRLFWLENDSCSKGFPSPPTELIQFWVLRKDKEPNIYFHLKENFFLFCNIWILTQNMWIIFHTLTSSPTPAKCPTIQFWHCLLGVNLRPHRLRCNFHSTAPTSDANYKSMPPLLLTNWP